MTTKLFNLNREAISATGRPMWYCARCLRLVATREANKRNGWKMLPYKHKDDFGEWCSGVTQESLPMLKAIKENENLEVLKKQFEVKHLCYAIFKRKEQCDTLPKPKAYGGVFVLICQQKSPLEKRDFTLNFEF